METNYYWEFDNKCIREAQNYYKTNIKIINYLKFTLRTYFKF